MSTTVNGTTGITFPDGTSQNTVSLPGMRNRIINGDFRIDQRNSGASVTLSGSSKYPVDRFIAFYTNTGGSATAQQSTNAPAGFKNSVVYTVTTGAALSAGDYSCVQQNIEGTNVSDLGWGTSNAQTVTLSFWVRASITGTYGVSILNNGSNRSFVSSYTVNSANTWEYKTITVTGDTTGTWTTDNSSGIRIYWDLGFGSGSNTSTTNTWLAGAYSGLTSGVKPSTTSGATFYITGVQLEKGSVATPFEYRPYGQELQLCQRYYYKLDTSNNNFWATAYASTFSMATVSFPVTMRANPTVTASANPSITSTYPAVGFCGVYIPQQYNSYVTAFNASAEL